MKREKNKSGQDQEQSKKMSVVWFKKDWCKNIFKGENRILKIKNPNHNRLLD